VSTQRVQHVQDGQTADTIAQILVLSSRGRPSHGGTLCLNFGDEAVECALALCGMTDENAIAIASRAVP